MFEPNLIEESRRLCLALKQRLPQRQSLSPDATFLGANGESITVKLPCKLQALVGSLAWRAHDFGTLACDLFRDQRVVPGAVITRALMETTALVYSVWKKTNQALSDSKLEALDDFLVLCLSGNRLGKGDPKSPNVLTAIQAVNKEPGCEQYEGFYASLCEFCHPNALGSFYAYCRFDDATRVTSFGHNRGLTEGNDVAFSLVFALEVLLEFLARTDLLLPKLTESAKKVVAERGVG